MKKGDIVREIYSDKYGQIIKKGRMNKYNGRLIVFKVKLEGYKEKWFEEEELKKINIGDING